MDFEQSQAGQAGSARVALWKAVPLFALSGGLLTMLVLVGPHPVLAFANPVGVLPWALAGALYAWRSNRGANDVTQRQHQLKTGAIAGATAAFAAACLGGLCVMPFLLSMGASLLVFLTWGPAMLAGFAFAGALTGALCGALVGRFCLEARP
jgi:hypothetical protein